MPILAGTKVNGRVGNTNFGGLVVGTDEEPGVVEKEAGMAVGRVKQNIWRRVVGRRDRHRRRSAGPTGQLAGRARTSPMRPRASAATRTSSSACGGSRPARGPRQRSRPHGFKIDYPNDLWDIALMSKRIGRDFDPSLGFVPRPGVFLHDGGVELQPAAHARTHPADVLRVRAVDGDGPERPVGELPRVHRAGELAVSQRRPVRVQRRTRRANG